jgi:hypothetical protein
MAWLAGVAWVAGGAAGLMAILTALRGRSRRTVIAWTVVAAALIGPVALSFLLLPVGD